MISWAVFASGEGTNLQNFLDLENRLKNQRIVLVHADRPCRSLERATASHKPSLLLDPKLSNYDDLLLEELTRLGVQKIFLLGYMRILSRNFLKRWAKPLVNLHPSLLPAYKGKDAVKKAFDAGEQEIGVSIHEVIEAVDEGKLLRQAKIALLPGESYESLLERVHALERKTVSDYLFDLDASA